MNKQILFKSALSLVAAVAAGSAFAATTSVYMEPFDLRNDGAIASPGTVWTSGANDQSEVVADPRGTGKVLELKTEGDTLTNSLATVDATTINTAFGNGDAVVFDAEVKFVPSDSLVTDLPEGTDDTKFALYAYAPDGGSTNLVVYHAYLDGEYQTQYTNDIIAVNGALDDPDAFSAISVKVFPYETLLFFTVKLNGTTLTATTPYMEGVDSTWFKTVNNETDAANKNFSAICFKGTGMVDNLGVSTENDTVTMIQVTLTNGGFTPTGLTTNGVDVTPIPETIEVADGTTVAFTVKNGDDVTKTIEINASASVNSIDFTGATWGWADYLGAAVDGAYEIDNLAELKLFQKGVANTNDLTTANTTFKLTDDITLDAAWPGIGLQNGKDVYNTQQFNDEAFLGTFDGQNHTISGFQMVNGLDYCGFFNSIYGATIQNLKISYAGNLFTAGTVQNSNECGATFVGVAKNSTLFNLTTVAGTVSCSKGFGGIVGYLIAGTTVDSCTNNVNLTSLKPNKAGGIAMITQNGAGKAIIRNCQNNGTIAGSNETGSLIGYVQAPTTTVENCESTVAYKLFHHQSNVVEIQGVTAVASVDPYTGAATPGLNFATVDNGVATFVADDALAASTTYKAMHAATATYEFAEAGSISFDTNMVQAVTFAITAAEGLTLTDATENGVVTYTAAAPAGFDGGDGVTTFSIAAATQTALEGNLPSGATLATVADAGTGLTYAQAYALGLWDENATEVAPLNAEITFDAQGQPKVELDATAGAAYDVTCKLYGSTSLPVATTGTPIATAGLGTALVDTTASSATAKFYKVVVVISDKQ